MCMKKIVLAAMTFSLLGLSSLSVADMCGPGNWVDTGTPGPLGWVIHYNADKTTGDAEAAKYICTHFYDDTNNCSKLPVTVGKATYNGCSYDTGTYTLQGLVSGNNVKTDCQAC